MIVFITGGAGFIGCNLADYHLKRGDDVIVFDNLSRNGSPLNLEWLKERYPTKRLRFIQGDIRQFDAVLAALESKPERVYHMAGQVAVTTSVKNPAEDFAINAQGTFNVLEATRQRAPEALFFYASTNKVYGGMEDVIVVEKETRYQYADHPQGISEQQPLDFHSPYGCSKGCGDQYARDYARIYGLRTVVFRQSCIYGRRQFGVEDQGWIAHFSIAAKLNRPITIYGNGKQVRDILWIDDLIEVYEATAARMDKAAGQIYNVGGGPDNAIAIWSELEPWLTRKAAHPLKVRYETWRPGDQKIYVSDIRKAARDLEWRPKVSYQEGLELLWEWIAEQSEFLNT